jgi:hypothetical protein
MPAIPDDSAKQSVLPQVAASKKAATTKARNAAKAKATALRNMPSLSGDVRATSAAPTCRRHDEHHVHGARAPPERRGVVLRFADLKRRGIVLNWPTLIRWIQHEDFPRGFWLAANSRAWFEVDVESWLASRPLPPRRANARTPPQT